MKLYVYLTIVFSMYVCGKSQQPSLSRPSNPLKELTKLWDLGKKSSNQRINVKNPPHRRRLTPPPSPPQKARSEAKELPADYPFVVPFIYKHKFPAATICSGSILTDRLILTAAYPIAIIPRGFHCVLSGIPHLANASEAQIMQKCIDIKDVYLPKNWSVTSSIYNVAIVELTTSIEFTLETATARVPFPRVPDIFVESITCDVPSWKYRDAVSAPGFPLKKIATELVRLKVIVDRTKEEFDYVWPKEEKDRFYMCSAILGMPLICDCNVVAVVVNRTLQGYMECSHQDYLTVISILRTDIEDFLNNTVPNSFVDVYNDYELVISNEDEFKLIITIP